MPGRFNIFQRVMLQWNELHPYNAVNVVRIPGAMDSGHLQNAVNGTLEKWGLTNLTLNRKNGTFHYHGGPVKCEIKIIAAGENSLAAEIERQINTAFVSGGHFNPFRFFTAQEQNSFSLGLVYFHPIADDGAAMIFLKEIIDDCLGKNAADNSTPIDIYPARHDQLLRNNPVLLAKKIAALPLLIRNIRSSSRPFCRDFENLDNGFDFFSLEPEILKSLLKTAKSWDVKLNDLFLAIMMKCFSPLAAKAQMAKRRKISVGCVVNTRKDIGLDNPRTFGLFLGSFTISHEIPDGISLKNLAAEICRQTFTIKRGKLYLGTPLDMAFAQLILPWFSDVHKKDLFRKNFPLWGGITNMNLNSLWESGEENKPVDYFRAVSTGPAVPFVLSVTTFNNRVNFGVTFRKSVFSQPEIERVKIDFLEMVKQLEAA